MQLEPLDALPMWGMFLAMLALTWLAMEAGYRYGRWRHAHATNEKDAPVGSMVASILGLLAFLLAFTFGMAATRFEEKRQTVLAEANAIGTTYLRTRLLPEPQRSKSASLLREYVDARITVSQGGNVAEIIARSEKLQESLWNEAIEAAENKSVAPALAGLYINALNETIDLHAKRLMIGLRNRIPIAIWAVLGALALLGMSSVGYQSGLTAAGRSPAMFVMVLAFTVVMYVIADLDRGHEGLLRVSQQSMIDLQNTMRAETSPSRIPRSPP